MPEAQGIPDYLALKVINNQTGVVVVSDLVHGHQTTWQERLLQPGLAGSSSLGTFRIVSPGAPSSEDSKRWRDQWSAIDLTAGQMRIEGYLGGRITGTPRYSGVVTGGRQPLNAPWEITGVDSLWHLQMSQIMPTEAFNAAPLTGTTAFGIAELLFGCQEVVWKDDFLNWNSGSVHPNSSDYNTTGTWTFTAADPYLGLTAMTTTSSSRVLLSTKQTWSMTSQYLPSEVIVYGTIVPNTGQANNGTAGGCEVWMASDSTPSNGVMVRLVATQSATGSNLFNVLAQIWSLSGGVFTQQGSVQVMTDHFGAITFEIRGVISRLTGTVSSPVLGMSGNGTVPSISSQTFPTSSGAIGVSTTGTSSGGASTQQLFVNRILFRSRPTLPSLQGTFTGWGTPRFAAGTSFAGSSSTTSPSSLQAGATNLDGLLACANADNAVLQKIAGAGYKGDSLNYLQLPINDYSGASTTLPAIMLREGVNISADGTEIASIPELLATDVRLNGIPGGDSGGAIVWARLGNVGDTVLLDTVADVGTTGYIALLQIARQIQARKVSPLVAKQVRVIRDSAWSSVGGGGGPRPGDQVQVHIPTLGINHQASVIQGIDFFEGDATMLVYLSALPAAAVPNAALQRIVRPIDYLTNIVKPR